MLTGQDRADLRIGHKIWKWDVTGDLNKHSISGVVVIRSKLEQVQEGIGGDEPRQWVKATLLEISCCKREPQNGEETG